MHSKETIFFLNQLVSCSVL